MCRTNQIPRGLIYWLPTQRLVYDFAATKVDDFIEDNIEELGGKECFTYNAGLKYLYGVPTYWRGLESKSGVKSISADAAVYDEYDEADQSQVAQARQRLSASDIKTTRSLSIPTIPDFGINKEFQETDQCHYVFKCESCGKWNILEDLWPNSFI
jgi:phage terminase large subunit GpA-like protein